jgi:probable F420-dependent oxidoreductase
MKLDRRVDATELRGVPERAKELVAEGFDGLWTAETKHDPFLPLLLASEHTDAEIGTAIAVAFARNPMTVAYLGWDLQEFSRGKFILGLGTQVRPHITRRFSMPWSKPGSQMREFVLALKAIWASWEDGSRLKFEGDFYTHNLMTPYFDPGPNPQGPPKVFLAAVGQRMAEIAGEVSDGLVAHVFQTPRYVHEVVLPAVTKGLAVAGRPREDFELKLAVFVVTGDTDAEMDVAADVMRKEIAFYASTPAYRPVLDIHGWGAVQDQLHELSRNNEWDAMGDVITDEILQEFAVICKPEEIISEVIRRYGDDVIDRIGFHMPYDSTNQYPARIAKSFRG